MAFAHSLSGPAGHQGVERVERAGKEVLSTRWSALAHHSSNLIGKDAYRGCLLPGSHRSDADHRQDSDPGSLILEQGFLTAALWAYWAA